MERLLIESAIGCTFIAVGVAAVLWAARIQDSRRAPLGVRAGMVIAMLLMPFSIVWGPKAPVPVLTTPAPTVTIGSPRPCLSNDIRSRHCVRSTRSRGIHTERHLDRATDRRHHLRRGRGSTVASPCSWHGENSSSSPAFGCAVRPAHQPGRLLSCDRRLDSPRGHPAAHVGAMVRVSARRGVDTRAGACSPA